MKFSRGAHSNVTACIREIKKGDMEKDYWTWELGDCGDFLRTIPIIWLVQTILQ